MQSILIVDDERFYTDILINLLKNDYQLITAKSGKEAQEKAELHQPNLILLDILMPDINGLDLCIWFKAHPLLRDIPVIFLTVKSSVADEMKGFELGAVDYITKPLSPPIVKARVQTQLALKAAHQKEQQRADSLDEVVTQRTKELLKEIEDRKVIVQTLRRQESDLRMILDNALAGMFSTDENGIILSFNPAAEKIFAYSENEVIGQEVGILFTKTSTQNYMRDVKQCFPKERSELFEKSGMEVTAIRKNNEPFPLQILVAELPSNGSSHQRFISSFFDISIQKQQERQLFQFSKMESLSALAGGIVHDYNNMLGVILGYAELLQAKVKHDPVLFNYADTIVKSAGRGSTLSKKLLSISRRDSSDKNQHDINHLVVDMQQILEKLLDVNIQLQVDLDASSCQAQLDAGDFNDALLNLCTNAKHAMPKGGNLRVSSKIFELNNEEKQILQLQKGDYIQLSITDTGTGMDEEVLAKLFDPFYTTKGKDGTGLGMTQVYSFMQRSHGAITVDSSPGKGSSFYLYFPLASALAPESESESEPEPAA